MRASATQTLLEGGLTRSTDRDEAVGRLARTVARRGYAIAFDLLGDSAEAEDAVQESLARACEGFGRLRDPAALEGWFYRVLTNLCMRNLRRGRMGRALRRLWHGDAMVRRPAEDPAGTGEIDIVDDRPRADEELSRARDTARTLHAVKGLPAMQRAALVLRYGHDCPVGEIAVMLGVGEGTIKTHLVRGLHRLRTEMENGHE